MFWKLSPDHAIIKGKGRKYFFWVRSKFIKLRNDFNCDIIGNKGSAHISFYVNGALVR